MREPDDDFSFQVGDIVDVKGIMYCTPSTGPGTYPSWQAEIVERIYDEEVSICTPYWYVVKPLSGALPHYRRNGIVSEQEILRIVPPLVDERPQGNHFGR
jgi:hypothetical protein